MPGLYWAETQDYIRVNRDGSMYWSPPAKDFSRETFVGIISVEGKDPATAHVVRPSASPFVFSDFKFAADGSAIDVDWKWRTAHRKPRGSHYIKNP